MGKEALIFYNVYARCPERHLPAAKCDQVLVQSGGKLVWAKFYCSFPTGAALAPPTLGHGEKIFT